MKELIKDYCQKLRWGNGLVKNYANIEALTHEEFLAKLLEMELRTREGGHLVFYGMNIVRSAV
jgi:hypothetical protein